MESVVYYYFVIICPCKNARALGKGEREEGKGALKRTVSWVEMLGEQGEVAQGT